MEKFDLNKHWYNFKNGRIAVNCKTEKLAKEFLEYCGENGLDINCLQYSFHEYEILCFSCKKNKINRISYSVSVNYIVVEFTGFNTKQTPQIDYNKTYSLQEIFELNEQFKDNNLKFINAKEVGNKNADIYYIENGVLCCGSNAIYTTAFLMLTMKFQVLKEVKYMSFQEAFNEFWNNKKIIHNDEYDTTFNSDEREYPEASIFSIEEILSNKWRIIDLNLN